MSGPPGNVTLFVQTLNVRKQPCALPLIDWFLYRREIKPLDCLTKTGQPLVCRLESNCIVWAVMAMCTDLSFVTSLRNHLPQGPETMTNWTSYINRYLLCNSVELFVLRLSEGRWLMNKGNNLTATFAKHQQSYIWRNNRFFPEKPATCNQLDFLHLRHVISFFLFKCQILSWKNTLKLTSLPLKHKERKLQQIYSRDKIRIINAIVKGFVMCLFLFSSSLYSS